MREDATPSEENERLLEFLYQVPVGLLQLDPQGNVSLMNAAVVRLLLPLAPGGDLSNLFELMASYAPELRESVGSFQAEHGVVVSGRRLTLPTGQGRDAPSCLSLDVVKMDPGRLLAVVQDVSQVVAQERLLFVHEQHFRAIFESMRDTLICTLDAQTGVDLWNTSGQRLFGYTPDEMQGRSLVKLVAAIDTAPEQTGRAEETDAGAPAVCFAASAIGPAMFQRLQQAEWCGVEGWFVRKDGSLFWGEGDLAALREGGGQLTGYSVVLRDTTARKLVTEQLFELATKDTLTKLANRRSFLERAGRELARYKRLRGALSLLMIDADRFKTVNDTHGHAVGDEVLKHLAAILGCSLRANDIPARYGGEEFIVLLPDTSPQGALMAAERVRAAIESSVVVVGEVEVRYTVSIGAASLVGTSTTPGGGAVAASEDPGARRASEGPGASWSSDESDSVSLEALTARADAALYRAKHEGRNRVVAG